ncbi:MAG: hypothetical protein RLP02_35860 [Coleofasciculus sp. C2-GNP5-27]
MRDSLTAATQIKFVKFNEAIALLNRPTQARSLLCDFPADELTVRLS